MKAPHDLPRQALVNKLMKGKELPKNSLLAAGLDPTMSGPTPRSARQFQRESFHLLCMSWSQAAGLCADFCYLLREHKFGLDVLPLLSTGGHYRLVTAKQFCVVPMHTCICCRWATICTEAQSK